MAHIDGTSTLDLQAFERYQTNYYASFSDTETIIEDLNAEGDRVAFRGVVRTVHTTEFMGVPAIDKRIIVPIIGFAKIINGKIAEWWNSPDRLLDATNRCATRVWQANKALINLLCMLSRIKSAHSFPNELARVKASKNHGSA